MRNTQIDHLCTCGKVVRGPLAKHSHRKACTGHRWVRPHEAYDLRKMVLDAEQAKGLP